MNNNIELHTSTELVTATSVRSYTCKRVDRPFLYEYNKNIIIQCYSNKESHLKWPSMIERSEMVTSRVPSKTSYLYKLYAVPYVTKPAYLKP